MQYINVHFSGVHFIQTNITFLVLRVKPLNVREKATHFLKPLEFEVLKHDPLSSYHISTSRNSPLKSCATKVNQQSDKKALLLENTFPIGGNRQKSSLVRTVSQICVHLYLLQFGIGFKVRV